MNLDDVDKKLLKLIQADLPLAPEPFREIAESLGIEEAEVIGRVFNMLEAGVIRRLGAIFDSRKIGYTGTLCALKVAVDRIDEVSAIVNSFPGVTHNYLREHTFNMWFTILAESKTKLDEILDTIRQSTGVEEIISLPAEKVFKIRVSFELD